MLSARRHKHPAPCAGRGQQGWWHAGLSHRRWVVAEPGREMGVNLLHANHRWCRDIGARWKFGSCLPKSPCQGLGGGVPCPCVGVPPAGCGHGDGSEVAQQPRELGNPGPHAAAMGRSIRRAGRADLKRDSPGSSCIHPPRGYGSGTGTAHPLWDGKPEKKMKIGVIPCGFYSPACPQDQAPPWVGYHRHHFLDFDISAPGRGAGRDSTEAKGVWLFLKKSPF